MDLSYILWIWGGNTTGYGVVYFEDMDVVNWMMNGIILEYLIVELWKAIMLEYVVVLCI